MKVLPKGDIQIRSVIRVFNHRTRKKENDDTRIYCDKIAELFPAYSNALIHCCIYLAFCLFSIRFRLNE